MTAILDMQISWILNSDNLLSIYVLTCKCLVPNWTNFSNFHPLEVVGRTSETQLQVSENLN